VTNKFRRGTPFFENVPLTRYWIYDDGGRQAAGYRGMASDCTCRAISIATQQPYQSVYDALNNMARNERPRYYRHGPRAGQRRPAQSARDGVSRTLIHRYMSSLGWHWNPTMQIGSGCTVHLRADELPAGRLVVNLSKHLVAVIDGVIHDLYDPSRDGTRCVYGYWYVEQYQ
jgi:hypothetical protein